MKNKILPVWSQEQNFYNLLGDLKLSVNIDENPYNISPDIFFSLAARQNRKRGFLFVSKLLGKHIPVKPHVPLLLGAVLSRLYMEKAYGIEVNQKDDIVRALVAKQKLEKVLEAIDKNKITLPEPTLVIGFAETATALGYALFSSFGNDATYIHTTRECIPEKPTLINFQEEHSHAMDHRLYALDEKLLSYKAHVILVDDEITTGKTALNLIEAIHKVHPRESYTVVSILDWRTDEHKKRFAAKEKELGIRICTVALLSGSIEVKGEPVEINDTSSQEASMTMEEGESKTFIHKLQKMSNLFQPLLLSSIDSENQINNQPYIKETGRFGIDSKDVEKLHEEVIDIANRLSCLRSGPNTLCLGTGEFMYIPLKISASMGEGVVYHSTTRSPIYPSNQQGYCIKNAYSFPCPYDFTVTNYLYNIPYGHYDDLFLFLEREVEEIKLEPLLRVLRVLGIPNIHVIYCMGNEDNMADPVLMGSYSTDDNIFLLKDVGNAIDERKTEDREEAIQGGEHYSETLPVEYKPSKGYMDLFHYSLNKFSQKLALAVAVVSERILKNRGKNLTLVSLARAGTPIGILIKRYLFFKYGLDLPHYSISIIRGKGFDENAVRFILKNHPCRDIQFVDGWTGKGAITKVLTKACKDFKTKYGISLEDDLAVLADPGHCVRTYGTREDFLIASSCLNSTVSGLLSRTIHRQDLIGDNDFHGAKYYKELEEEDVSNLFIDTVTDQFPMILDKVDSQTAEIEKNFSEPNWLGLKDMEKIQKEFCIEDMNLIKPGIGETTRVLLRRMPWKILVKDLENPNLEHILFLAKEKTVPVVVYPSMIYQCCGLIKPWEGE